MYVHNSIYYKNIPVGHNIRDNTNLKQQGQYRSTARQKVDNPLPVGEIR